MTQVTASLLTFQGEMDVEDDCFECVVERLIVSRDRASIQMRCRDDGGPHIAEGSFEFVNGQLHMANQVIFGEVRQGKGSNTCDIRIARNRGVQRHISRESAGPVAPRR
jgi:hypothetical protein